MKTWTWLKPLLVRYCPFLFRRERIGMRRRLIELYRYQSPN